MLRLTNNLTRLSINAEQLNRNLQTVRWRRKPRWMPPAKTKMFKIPTRPVIAPDENEELKRLNNNYRNHMKSLKKFVVLKMAAQHQLDDSEHRLKAAEEDFERCNKINEEWNAKVRVEREKFFEEQIKKDVEIAKQKLEFQQFKEALKIEEAENIVRQQKEEAKNFITPENVEVAIQHALENVVDHNFSIDLDGNKYYGRATTPKKEEKEKSKIGVKQ